MTSPKSGPVIRPLEPADATAFVGLIDALAGYESLAGPDDGARDRLIAHAFADPPLYRALIVELDGKAVGYAVYFFTYSTFLAQPTLYLEDIFVLPEARGQGIGGKVFRRLARQARDLGCGRMEWQVLTWNQPSIEFYERRGASRMTDWHTYRLDADGIDRLASGPGAAADRNGSPA